jgi:hypothetical protein
MKRKNKSKSFFYFLKATGKTKIVSKNVAPATNNSICKSRARQSNLQYQQCGISGSGQDILFSAFVCNFNKRLKTGICSGLDQH